MKTKMIVGILAIIAALIALLITMPFAAAYFRAYGSGQVVPALTKAFGRAYPNLLNFDRAAWVYQLYGRLYSLVIPLTIPAMLRLKEKIGIDTRRSLWGWRVFYWGVLMFGLGVFGDYWPNPNSYVVGAGFLLEIVGSLVIWVGAIIFGMAALKGDAVPRWIGVGLVGIAPMGILGILLTGHIPAGPLLGYVMFWLVTGYSMLRSKDEK